MFDLLEIIIRIQCNNLLNNHISVILNLKDLVTINPNVKH